jgi:hypothetical protein
MEKKQALLPKKAGQASKGKLGTFPPTDVLYSPGLVLFGFAVANG